MKKIVFTMIVVTCLGVASATNIEQEKLYGKWQCNQKDEAGFSINDTLIIRANNSFNINGKAVITVPEEEQSILIPDTIYFNYVANGSWHLKGQQISMTSKKMEVLDSNFPMLSSLLTDAESMNTKAEITLLSQKNLTYREVGDSGEIFIVTCEKAEESITK